MQLVRLLIAAAPLLGCGSAASGEPDAGGDAREAGAGAPRAQAAEDGGDAHSPRLPALSAEELAALPPDGGDAYNRLVFEKSPYLLQHARNPVDWYPWGEEAFARARAEDKPIFLSIGYSTCHWCHVMEHESFEDTEVAALLNASFVCVKVDREERPDVDQVYMTATQAATNGGGWPMTIVMTPERQPFFAGTYFPKASQPGRPGMLDIVPSIAEAWRTQREALVQNAEQLSRLVVGLSGGAPGELPGEETLNLGGRQLASTYDAIHGGFGSAPKFPVPHNLNFLLRRSARTGEATTRMMVDATLDAMRRGGIWDHVGFGFHRYSTDPRWLLPHFEKMLYDQALIANACIEAWQATGNALHRDTAERIFEYVLRDMTSPEGGFYSAEDADSEGEEGLFYLWTPAELREVLGDEDGALAIEVWSVEEGGNFLDQATGLKTGDSILHLAEELPVTAARLSVGLADLKSRLESMRARLFAAREARVHPLKDTKVLTDWNGLMIAALAKGARVFGDERYATAARRAANFVLSELRDENGRLLKRWRDGHAAFPAVLDDYAFAVWGLIELYETDFDTRWLESALELTELQRVHFLDAEQGGFFLSADDGEELLVRSKESYDGAVPSGNSVAALNLVRLARLTGREELEGLARETVQAFGAVVAEQPYSHTAMLLAVDFLVGPSHEVVIVGQAGAADTDALLGALRRPFLPNVVTVLRPSDEEAPAIARLAPYVAAQTAVEGRATAYVCRDFACQAPTTDPAQMLANLGLASGQR